MKYNVKTGEIQPNIRYIVAGEQSVIYNEKAYVTGDEFIGINGLVDFTYDGAGTQVLNEATELLGGGMGLEVSQSGQYNEVSELAGGSLSLEGERPILYNDPGTNINGLGIEFNQAGSDIQVMETTLIRGFGVEFQDYLAYVNTIQTRRL
ncbi:hypothetical protein DBR40_21540 [Pedobacter sp. KBW01]|uniref:hypothetical protein n=1 Tax=Pedobacter sp. KBW01 TaxID=2153364 RepID=UPI000F59E394|nr:hypothetical protein [Pedobacter sp. KBW01]RQO66839.1 hypothetical protein DBR40_21540 [Pedobacter sp. KBW01]